MESDDESDESDDDGYPDNFDDFNIDFEQKNIICCCPDQHTKHFRKHDEKMKF